MSTNGSENTFNGLTQDASKAKFNKDKYYDALNMRLITHSGLSTGALETTKGTKLDFKLPNIPAATYEENGENGTIIVPAQTNLKILGGTYVNNKVIIFSHGNSSDQIWMFDYNESTDEIVGINPTTKELDLSTHLKYNRDLNFSMDNRIKAVAREESTKFLRVYWVDGGRNNFRSINLYNADSLNIPVRSLDLQPEVNMELPLLDKIINGRLPNGRIQYFYRLLTKDGNITNYSPLSQLIDLNNGDISGNSGLYPEVFEEDNLDLERERDKKERIEFDSEKGVIITLPNAVDKDYDYIQWGYILYKEFNVPECFLFPERYLITNSDGTKTSELVHTGNDEKDFPISIEEVNSIYNIFKNPNTLTNKNNLMFLANVDNEVYTSEVLEAFDTRSYRFDGNVGDTRTRLYDSDGSYYLLQEDGSWIQRDSGGTPTGLSGDNWSIPETADCINPSNDESNNEYDLLYQSNGTTFGGTGLNVDYKFVMADIVADASVGDATNFYDIQEDAPFYKSPKSLSSSYTFGVTNQTFDNLQDSYDDLTSPYKSYILAGHARGEVYRYGVVFYNLQNQPSFVKWIGDIKYPQNHQGDDQYTDYNYFSYDSVNDYELVHPLYLEFTFRLPQALRDEISGMSIVRVERKDEDKTKLGTALTGGFLTGKDTALTLDTFRYIIVDLTYRMIKRVAGSNGVMTFVSAVFEDQIRSAIDNVLSSKFNPVTGALFQNTYLTEDDLLTVIRTCLTTLSGDGGIFFTNPITSIFKDALLEQVVQYVFDEVKDLIKRKVAGIDENVLWIGGSAYSYNNTSYGQMYTIFPEQQFNRYRYRNGDYLNISHCFDDIQNISNQDCKVMINPFHRDKKTGLNIRTNSTAVVKKWCYGTNLSTTLAPLTLNISAQYDLNPGEIVSARAAGLNSAAFKDFYLSNSYIGYVEKYTDDAIDTDTYTFGYKDASDAATSVTDLLTRRYHVMGLGDRKHVLRLNNSLDVIVNEALINPVPQNIYIKDNQQYFPYLSTDYNDGNYLLDMTLTGINESFIQGGATYTYQLNSGGFNYDIDNSAIWDPSGNNPKFFTQYPRVLHTNGDCIVSYERYVTNQYGGNTYQARTLNDYMEVCYINKSELTDTTVFKAANGDTYVGMYGAVDYNYYFENWPGYEKAGRVKKAMIHCFPAEASFNFNLREGYHANNAASADDLNETEQKVKRKVKRLKRKAKRAGIDLEAAFKNSSADIRRFIFDDFVYYEVYNQQNNAKVFKAKPAIDILSKESRNRIWMSNNKLDGELVDSWKLFKPLDYLDVESSLGPITELTTFKDNLIYFQSNAFGTVLTNEISAVTDDVGRSLTLASAKPLSGYKYISTESGCSHRFGVVTTDSNLFYVDTLRKKIFKFGQGLEPISDSKDISGKIRELCTGDIVDTDSTCALIGLGVHGAYYPEHNTVFFTFMNKGEREGRDGIEEYQIANTLSFNLILDQFESFHSFKPGLYIKTPNRLLCENPELKSEGYQIYKGEYNMIFGTTEPSYVTVVANKYPKITKVFNNLLLHTEVYENGTTTNMPNVTIDQVQCWNDYQNTGTVLLTPGSNIRRIERKWNLQVPRDTTAAGYSTLSKPRMRDTHLFIKLLYNNVYSRRLVLHDINTFFQESIT
ncbi:MAG: hypothetical protein E6R13_01660 [Spirochaetes bacterium]|nr:MAG: hypothetical protein E6R13_01660 [Spirochaetota bacterium]